MAATAAVYNRLHNSSLMMGGGGGGGVVVGGGHHSQLARSLERILDEAHHSGELILTNRKLKDFPKTATKYNLTDTVIADLSRNRFCELPEEVTTFSFLETLLLYHNTIRSIPESVKCLTSLTYLDLRSNQLSALPREICFLPLQVLLVSNNRLLALPDELGRMDRLTDLDAAYNQLSSLPARIGELRSLRSFSLRSNQLMYLPRELTCLTLVSLDVSNNRISSLPLEIRQMSTLVEFNLENNPLTSPPASLCVRGLVHVFKFLETQATKDEKGSRAGGNYDGYTTLRRAPRHNSSGNVLESNRVPRHHVDSGYSTCDGIDKRWSHDMPSTKPKSVSPVRKTPTTPPSLIANLMDASLSSSTSTIVDEPISSSSAAAAVVKPTLAESFAVESTLFSTQSPSKQRAQPLQPATLHQHINYAHSTSSSNGSSPDQEDAQLQQQPSPINHHNHSKSDDKLNKNLGNIQTYKEYKEALKQQRNQEISSVYKIKGQKTLFDMSEATNALNSNSEQSDMRANGASNGSSSPHTGSATLPKSIMKNGTGMNGINGSGSNGTNHGDECLVLPKKPIQKVIPSRYTESNTQARLNSSIETNGDCSLGGYVKPNSPLKTANGGGGVIAGILTNNNATANKFSAPSTLSTPGMKSPVAAVATSKLGSVAAAPITKNRVTWNHDIPAEKLSFTMRREFDRQREETELMTQLRSIIETRLKMTLPEDIASALTDGVILCHLANYVRPRSVASIHVPSPGVSKLTMARCRRNVENFLEACLKIGVDEELICSCADVVPPYDSDNNDLVGMQDDNNSFYNNDNNNDNNTAAIASAEQQAKLKNKRTLPNPSAVLRTVSALIALDCNPHHQNIRNLQQQQQLHSKLQQYEAKEKQQQQHYQNSRYEQVETQQEPQQHYEQEQHTATGTKKQQQQTQQHAIFANMEFNSTFNFETKACHFENTNGNDEHNAADADNVVANDDNVVNVAYNVATQTQQQQQQQQHAGIVGNFFRHAKLKTFQKIKLNLIPTHAGGSKNNHCSMLTTATTTTLQTIVETENDGGNNFIGGSNSSMTSTDNNGIGGYQLINERPQQVNNDNNSGNIANSNNKYKLLELPTLELSTAISASNGNVANKKIVSKRIEFFEHSSGGSPPEVDVKTKIKNGNAGNGGGIFSIYRVADLVMDNKLLTGAAAQQQQQQQQQQQELSKATKEVEATAASPLLKHDSHVLTIILSCVFIVTFLLLVFFPLPG